MDKSKAERIHDLIWEYVSIYLAGETAGNKPVREDDGKYRHLLEERHLKDIQIEVELGLEPASTYELFKEDFENKLYLLTDDERTQWYKDKFENESIADER